MIKELHSSGDILFWLCVYVADRWHPQMLQLPHRCWYLFTGHLRSPLGCCRCVRGWHLTVSIFAFAHSVQDGFTSHPLLQAAGSIQFDSILKANLTKIRLCDSKGQQHMYYLNQKDLTLSFKSLQGIGRGVNVTRFYFPQIIQEKCRWGFCLSLSLFKKKKKKDAVAMIDRGSWQP